MFSQPLTAAGPTGWILAIAAAIAYAIPALATQHLQETGARRCLRLAWALHALLLGWGLLGELPRFGFAPALSITAWLVLTVYVVEQQLYPQLRSRWPLSILGSVAVLLAVVFPGTPLHVNASAWLPLHLALGIASYGLFAAAVVHAALMNRAESRLRRKAAEPKAEAAAQARLPVSLGYGSTETMAMVAAQRPEEFAGGDRSAGRPMPHARLALDAAGVVTVTG